MWITPSQSINPRKYRPAAWIFEDRFMGQRLARETLRERIRSR
jgi:hypothetical protein